MGNNFSKPVRHNVRKQGQKPRQHGTAQSSQKLSREQLIHRIETLREELELLDTCESADKQKEKILLSIKQYSEQLNRYD